MKEQYEKLLTVILTGGSIFAWFTIYNDFLRFQSIYGTIFRIYDCSTPNPVLTPCFYGGFGFLLAFFWSIKKKMNHLFYLLIGCVVFAWSNFAFEAYKFYFIPAKVKVSCSGIPTNSIFTTPCFYGAMIFLLALVTIIFYRRELRQNNFEN